MIGPANTEENSPRMINGFEVRDLQVNAEIRGQLVEVFREDWEVRP